MYTCVCHGPHVEVRRQFTRVSLSFLHMGSEDEAQVMGCGSKALCSLSILLAPHTVSLLFTFLSIVSFQCFQIFHFFDSSWNSILRFKWTYYGILFRKIASASCHLTSRIPVQLFPVWAFSIWRIGVSGSKKHAPVNCPPRNKTTCVSEFKLYGVYTGV